MLKTGFVREININTNYEWLINNVLALKYVTSQTCSGSVYKFLATKHDYIYLSNYELVMNLLIISLITRKLSRRLWLQYALQYSFMIRLAYDLWVN